MRAMRMIATGTMFRGRYPRKGIEKSALPTTHSSLTGMMISPGTDERYPPWSLTRLLSPFVI